MHWLQTYVDRCNNEVPVVQQIEWSITIFSERLDCHSLIIYNKLQDIYYWLAPFPFILCFLGFNLVALSFDFLLRYPINLIFFSFYDN